LREAIRLAPFWPEGFLDFAIVELQLGRPKAAEILAKQATRLMPASPLAYWILGVTFHDTGQFREASDAFERAIALGFSFQKNAQALSLLAETAQRANLWTRANHYKSMLQLKN